MFLMPERGRDAVHTTSSPPSVCTTSETMLSTCFSLLTSTKTQCIRRPREATSSAVILSIASREGMSLSATSKPSVASRSAMARPMPWLAPVTRATPFAIVISIVRGENEDWGAKRNLDGVWMGNANCRTSARVLYFVGVTWVRDINITEPWNRAVRVQAIRIPGGEGEFRFHGCMMVSKSRVRSKDTETCSRS